MVNPTQKPTEMGEHLKAGFENKKEPSKGQEAAELTSGLNARGILEGMEGEDGGMEMGEVKEKAQEGIGEQSQTTSGKFQQFQTKLSAEEAKKLKAKLLKEIPTPKQMVEQIQKHIHKEMEDLYAQSIIFKKGRNLKELNEVVRGIRNLKHLLAQLVHATTEMIKNIWLKIVHGIPVES